MIEKIFIISFMFFVLHVSIIELLLLPILKAIHMEQIRGPLVEEIFKYVAIIYLINEFKLKRSIIISCCSMAIIESSIYIYIVYSEALSRFQNIVSDEISYLIFIIVCGLIFLKNLFGHCFFVFSSWYFLTRGLFFWACAFSVLVHFFVNRVFFGM